MLPSTINVPVRERDLRSAAKTCQTRVADRDIEQPFCDVCESLEHAISIGHTFSAL
jgi:hypothetical protein